MSVLYTSLHILKAVASIARYLIEVGHGIFFQILQLFAQILLFRQLVFPSHPKDKLFTVGNFTIYLLLRLLQTHILIIFSLHFKATPQHLHFVFLFKYVFY